MKKGESAHNPLGHGVYVEGHGVIQPNQTVRKKDEDGVSAALKAGILTAGRAPRAEEDPAAGGDPHPATITAGALPVDDNDDQKENAE